jgi:O-antigen ligase
MQSEFTLPQTMADAFGKQLVQASLDGVEGKLKHLPAKRSAAARLRAGSGRLFYRHPLFMIGALWPVVLLSPHLPGLPRPSIGGLPWRQELATALLLTAALAVLCVRKQYHQLFRCDRRTLPVVLSLTALVFWTIASAAWAANPTAALHLGMQWTTYLVYFLVLSQGLRNRRVLASSLSTLAGVILVLAIACAIESWFGAPLTDGNLRSDLKPLLRGSGGFGEIMAMAAILFAGLALTAERRGRALFFGVTAMMAWLATLQSLERAPLLGAAAGFAFLFAAAAIVKSAVARPWGRLGLLLGALGLVFCLQSFSLPNAPPNEGATSTMGRFNGTLSGDISTRVRYLFWGAGLEMARAHPLVGVGGNNYDIAFATARAQFASRYPHSPLVALNEDLLTVYAHNEYVQILAELGAVGFVLFMLLSLSLVVAFLRAMKRRPGNLLALGAAGALLAFAISSGASASSFRNFGGGLVFFFLAALLNRIATTPSPASANEPVRLVQVNARFRPALTAGLCALMVVVSGGLSAQGAGTVLHGLAQSSEQPAGAENYYQASLRVLPSRPATHFGYGLWLYQNHRAPEAVSHLQYAATNGFNSSICYAYLAGAAVSAGDLNSAAQTLATAVAVYPRSVFLLVRYSEVLKGIGQVEASQAVFSRALSLDQRAARGWQELIANDIDAAYLAAQRNKDIAMPGELVPQAAVFEVLQENEQRFPEAVRTGWRARMQAIKQH